MKKVINFLSVCLLLTAFALNASGNNISDSKYEAETFDADCSTCPDADGDGYLDIACGGDDCDDSDYTVNPGADDPCNDGCDQNCNGIIDDPEICCPLDYFEGPIDTGVLDEWGGWYDVSGCGTCNAYCRWIGVTGSGGDPSINTYFLASIWACHTPTSQYTEMGGGGGGIGGIPFTAVRCDERGGLSILSGCSLVDSDGDGVLDGDDSAPLDNFICQDLDGDGCDDCASGIVDPSNDGTDTDGDGLCDLGDTDDDGDGTSDVDEIACGSDPLNANSTCEVCDCENFNLINGGFEQPGGVSNYIITPQSNVPGWSSTDPGGIEIWQSGFNGFGPINVPSYEGGQFAELNAYVNASLFQDVNTCPGETYDWEVAHRGRDGVETALVEFGPPGGPYTPVATMEDGTTGWGSYSGSYEIPTGQNITRIRLTAVTFISNPARGNFVDGFVLTPNNCNDPDGDGVTNDIDNCPNNPNPGQEDGDGDGIGDACENQAPVANCQDITLSADANCQGSGTIDNGSYDPDGDPVTITLSPVGPYAIGTTSVTLTIDDGTETAECTATVTVTGSDTDGDGICDAGDACPLDADNDADGDGVCGDVDNCPADANSSQEDNDNDGIGDVCDDDDDNDGTSDADEIACGSDPSNAASTCEVCDGLDNDLDGDTDEGFIDTDGDLMADCVDPDDDNDGVLDVDDSAPLDNFICQDLDNDGCDDCASGTVDAANDGLDTDRDGLCDLGDPDDDNDGIEDECDSNALVDNFTFNGVENLPAEWICGNNSKKPKVYICHIPPGNPANAHTICVSPNAVQAHLDHGCMLGECVSCSEEEEGSNARIEGEKTLKGMTLYPNPAIGNISLLFETNRASSMNILVSDAMGKTMHRQDEEAVKGANEIRLDVGHWLNGIYFIRVEIGLRVHVLRFVKTDLD